MTACWQKAQREISQTVAKVSTEALPPSCRQSTPCVRPRVAARWHLSCASRRRNVVANEERVRTSPFRLCVHVGVNGHLRARGRRVVVA
jgi:hypothetical protein